MLRKVYYSLPPNARFWARRLYYYPTDLLDYYSGKRDRLTPPKGMIYTGSGDFKAQGKKILNNIIQLTDLKAHHRILDIGSGIGRLAVPLTQFLSTAGSYEGFDVVKTGVDWCNSRIKPEHPNFNFKYIDLKNDLYKQDGAEAKSLSFPYPDNSFDRIALISVFTHMIPEEVAHYLSEISRVLKSGGRCFATFFLYDTDTADFRNPNFQFPHLFENHALMDKQVQSANVAFDQSYLRQQIESRQMKWSTYHEGYWNLGIPKETAYDFQDIVIIEKI